MEISLAPMLDVTTPYFRKFIRQYCKETVLFTEMIVCDFIINSKDFMRKLRFLDEKTVIQLGGSCPEKFVEAIGILKKNKINNRINLNCGCPSERVKNGCFGAVLMKNADKVIDIINETEKRTGVLMSIKMRNGVDEFDSFEFFEEFVEKIKNKSNCREFYVHARKCWLNGLSPSQNRSIPPINYDFAYKIKEKHPDLKIYLNGQVDDLNLVKNLDGVMIGRQAMKDILIFHKINKILHEKENGECPDQQRLFSDIGPTFSVLEKISLVKSYLDSLEGAFSAEKAFPINVVFKGEKFCKKYKMFLNEIMRENLEIAEAKIKLDNFFGNILE